ncbi:MAG: hypothetical protein ACUVRD_08190 [Bacteroidia bacterium]
MYAFPCFLWLQQAVPLIFKWMPLALIDPFQYTLHGGLEIPIRTTLSVQPEAGWVIGYLGGGGSEDFGGYKLRLSIRRFYSLRKNNPLEGAYVALVGTFHNYTSKTEADTSYYGGYPRIPVERRIESVGGVFAFGYQVSLNALLFFDFYGGLGVRRSRHRYSPFLYPYASFSPIGDILFRSGTYPFLFLSLSLGMRL